MHRTLVRGIAALALMAGVLGAQAASAATVLITSSGQLNADDSIGWSQLGVNGTILTGAQSVVSTSGLNATVSSELGMLERRDQGTGWSGNFAAGEQVLLSQDQGSITIDFAQAVYGAGAQIQSNIYGAFTATIYGYGQALLGSYTILGDSTYSPDGNSPNDNTANFLGIMSTQQEITRIVFNVGTSHGFALGTLRINAGPAVAVPGPIAGAGLPIMMAFGGLVWARRRKAAPAAVA